MAKAEEQKAAKLARRTRYMFAGGMVTLLLSPAVFLFPDFPGKLIIEAALLLVGVGLLVPTIYLFSSRGRGKLNPSLADMSGPSSTPPPDSLTSLLGIPYKFQTQRVQFQVVSVYKGVTAEVTRESTLYRIKVKLPWDKPIKSVRQGVGAIIVTKRGGLASIVTPYVTINEWSLAKYDSFPGQGGTTLDIDCDRVFPCSGFVNQDSLGYIFAPIVSVDLGTFEHVMIMPLESEATNYRIVPDKPTLEAVSGGGTARATLGPGETLSGSLEASGFKEGLVDLSIHRVPVRKQEHPSRYGWNGFYEESIVSLTTNSGATFSWRPSAASFKPTAWVLKPLTNTPDFIDLVQSIGESPKEAKLSKVLQPFFFGDSRAMDHNLVLTVKDGRKSSEDRTRLALS